MSENITVGLALAKNVFQVHGADGTEHILKALSALACASTSRA